MKNARAHTAATPGEHGTACETAIARWNAVLSRDVEADGAFVFAVTSTGIYCRPSCPARRPLRRNVRFFILAREAEVAGFRPCKRCRPDDISSAQRAAQVVEAACRTLEDAHAPPLLAVLAERAGMSPHHFHRTFKAHTGLTPRAYHDALRGRRAERALGAGRRVTEASFDAGFQNLSRFHDHAAARFGLTPSSLGNGGRGEVIVVAQGRSTLGVVTAAFSRRGVCAVRLTDAAPDGIGEVVDLYRHALVLSGGADFERLVAEVIAVIEEPRQAVELPLDIRGTAFEERVWARLRQIPVGTTATYGEIAAAIGAPTAHRAVARACGANPIAVLIPCHRVVRADGGLAGYRWGIARKDALLKAERASRADGGS